MRSPKSVLKTAVYLTLITFSFMLLPVSPAQAAPEGNVYIFYSEATHGPEVQNYPAFCRTWKKRLTDRGLKVSGGTTFPGKQTLKQTDLLLIYRKGIDDVSRNDRKRFEQFVKQGGGVVVLHNGVRTQNHSDWYSNVIGGAFVPGKSKTSVNQLQGYYFHNEYKTSALHPIIQGVSNMDLPKEEVFWKTQMADDANVLAKSYHKLGVIAPQMWTTTHGEGRVFAWLTGHRQATFDRPHVRGVLLRGLTWAADEEPVDKLLTETEKSKLKYHEGGPVAPENAASTIELHPEFELDLVAGDAMVSNPIDLRFGERGNLWVIEANEYPWKEASHGAGLDRIMVLKDSDGDGRMDQKQVFADDLALVTGFEFYKEGLLVSAPPNLWYIKDTDGDLKEDERTKIFNGLSIRDTHATLSNLHRGFDGWIYANNGYAQSTFKTPSGEDRGTYGNGPVRFQPDGSAAQKIDSKGGNEWGMSFAPDGDLFWSRNNSPNHLFHVFLPEWLENTTALGDVRNHKRLPDHRGLNPAMKAERFAYKQIDNKGAFTSGAGTVLYTGGAWPEKYHMNSFLSDPTVWLTHRDVVKRDSLSYTASRGRENTEFIRSTDYWFAPVNHRIGPDGALYIADFYRQTVIHNDTRGGPHGKGNASVRPDRYNTLGRIWRVQHKNAEPHPVPQLAGSSPSKLVNALTHPNQWVRRTAQRLLVDQQQEKAENGLRSLLHDEEAYMSGRVRALWTLDHLGKLTVNDLGSAVTSNSTAVQKNACRVIVQRGEAPDKLRSAVRTLAGNTSDPQVRLDALIALLKTAKKNKGTVKEQIKTTLKKVE